MKFINDYPYTNMTAQNIDWLIKAVVDLIHQGKTDEEIKNAPGISEAYGAFCNAYPYTNMTMQNIDWLISSVRELYDKEATLEENITKIEAQMETLQADVNNIVNKFGDKVDKLNVKNNVYVTDGSTPPKTTGIAYSELPVEGTIPFRDGIGSIQVPVAQDATQAVNKGQMDDALAGKVDKTTEPFKIYGTGINGEPNLYAQSSGNAVRFTVPLRNEKGAIVAANPTQNNELTTKEYVDTAITAAPTGGWTTIIDKTWTEDEAATTSSHLIAVSIPEQYRKPMKALRITAYMDTPETGEIYKDTASGSRDGIIYFRDFGSSTNRKLSWIKGLPSKKTTQVTVNFASNSNNITVLGNGSSDLFNDCYAIRVYKDSNGNIVQPIPTDPNALLNTSKIIGIAEGNQETVEYVLNTCLPNRSHYYTTTSTQTTVNYTSNDYYNDQLPECIISQVLTSTDTTNLPVGSFICVERRDLIIALNISISFTSTVPISYKSIAISESAIIGETIINTMRAYTKRNTMTSFDQFDTSLTVDTTDMYTNPCSDGYPTALYIYPGQSGGETATSKYIMYKGSRLIVQAQY